MSREEQQEQQELQVVGPGQILKSARLSANLSVKDIALKIHLKSIMIENIEADKYDSNISLTFIKGYIKLYAKQVSVSESEIMAAFESINTQKKEPAKLQSFSRRVAHQANDDKLMLVTYFILAVVFALVVIWWFQQGEKDDSGGDTEISATDYVQESTEIGIKQSTRPLNTSEKSASLAILSTNEDAGIAENSDPQQLSLEPVLDTLNKITQVSAQKPVATERKPVAENLKLLAAEKKPLATDLTPSALALNSSAVDQETLIAEPQQGMLENEQPQMAPPVELVFTFAEDCWMNLSDATGENIAYGVKVSGRVMTVSGLPPFIVTLGAPQAVQIDYAGEAVDMSVFKPGNTAKFTLPLAN